MPLVNHEPINVPLPVYAETVAPLSSGSIGVPSRTLLAFRSFHTRTHKLPNGTGVFVFVGVLVGVFVFVGVLVDGTGVFVLVTVGVWVGVFVFVGVLQAAVALTN